MEEGSSFYYWCLVPVSPFLVSLLSYFLKEPPELPCSCFKCLGTLAPCLLNFHHFFKKDVKRFVIEPYFLFQM